jgi:catechol 2,3-dioxygenase-like lactoylglutathione lyase family enzyme
MRINRLDHFNIVANAVDMERVTRFYTELLGFKEGPRPDLPIGGAWLYKDEFPLVHLSEADSPDLPHPGLHDTTTGSVHHIAFDCEGIEEFKTLFEKNDIEYEYGSVESWNIQQLFFHDPSGTRIELNFKNG